MNVDDDLTVNVVRDDNLSIIIRFVWKMNLFSVMEKKGKKSVFDNEWFVEIIIKSQEISIKKKNSNISFQPATNNNNQKKKLTMQMKTNKKKQRNL